MKQWRHIPFFKQQLKRFTCIQILGVCFSYFRRKWTSLTDHEVIVYRITDAHIAFLQPLNGLKFSTTDAAKLPETLIMKKAVYLFNDEMYDCSESGNYYFIHVQKINQQRILIDRKSALKTALMFSLLFIRGNKDDYKTNTALKKTALSRFLINTCGRACELVQELLTEVGFQARVVWTITNREQNSYNNGHIMIEVFDEQEQKFFLVDVDKKMYFTDTNGHVLNLYEFSEHLNYNKTVKFHKYIHSSMVDWGNFQEVNTGFNYQFIEQSFYFSDKQLLKLYKRICAIPLIKKGNHRYGTLFTPYTIPKNCQNITFVSNKEFQHLAYTSE